MPKAKHHHSVYVVELDEAVLKQKKFCAANPNFDPYLSCLYVGMTGLDPEVRFENFQESEGAGIFLLSLRAAGTGLNLTTASYVVLYDPWWNPAVEAQAIDRTHRIGQTKTVNAYKLIAPGTVEEKIWNLQQSKRQTISDVLGEKGFAKSLTKTDLEFLFGEE